MNINRPLYIFDLDGTLALNDHRKSILDTDDADKWDKFNLACDMDEPNMAIIKIFKMVINQQADFLILSGRSDIAKDKTIEWLNRHTGHYFSYNDLRLVMRKQGDNTPDDVLKKQWLDNMFEVDRRRIVAVFDDRDSVVKMWRANGLTCLQVAPGDF